MYTEIAEEAEVRSGQEAEELSLYGTPRMRESVGGV
jgi:hypothetical protein